MVSEGARPWGRGRAGDCEQWGELDPLWLDLRFQGRPDFQSRLSQMLAR